MIAVIPGLRHFLNACLVLLLIMPSLLAHSAQANACIANNANGAATAPVSSLIPANNSAGEDLLEFTSNGHVLTFNKDSAMIAARSHLLKTSFIGARAVVPQAETSIPAGNASTPPALGRVTYRDLWDGVTVVYAARDGAIVESTYYVDTTKESVPAANIRLEYNRPVKLDRQGNLIIAYESGNLVESAPVAWQEIEGQRKPVDVAYALYGERELGFSLGSHVSGVQVVIDPVITWNTFLGAAGNDYGLGLALDSSGNTYIVGYGSATWGASPVLPYAGGLDAFAARLSDNGTLEWNTFLGSSATDSGLGIAVDGSGNVYVTGESSATWGSPVRAYSASTGDAFAAKLNSTTGEVIWNTFLGGSGYEHGTGIAVDGSGNVFVTGYSGATWGSPVRAYDNTVSAFDAFAARLSDNGTLEWNTFLGGEDEDKAYGVTLDSSGDVLISGYSNASWNSNPVHVFTSSGTDAFAAKLNGTTGVLAWNTFLGYHDTKAYGIAVDSSGNVYVTGESSQNWGSPVRSFSSGIDAFAAKLASNGETLWTTFLGTTGNDYGRAIDVDSSGKVYIAGESDVTWGSPEPAAEGGTNAYAARLSDNGTLEWNGFLGAYGTHHGYGIAVDGSGNVIITGSSNVTWGSPKRDYTADQDAFVAKITLASEPLSSAKAITAFDFNGLTPPVVGVINEGAHTIALTVPHGTTVTALVPAITITGASVDPASGEAQNFTSPVTYTVTAEDSSTQEYVVTVTVASGPASSAKAITAFDFDGLSSHVSGKINESAHTISLKVPFGSNLTTLVPTITITGASVDPASGIAQNFTSPVTYTVTAEDSSTQEYIVTVMVVGPLHVTSPNGGETWGIGSSYNITWYPSGVAGTVNILLSRDGGTSYAIIKSRIGNSGAYQWTATAPATAAARIKVVSATQATVNDISDANFTIATPPAAPRQASPRPGETVTTLTPDLDWNDVTGAASYGVQVSQAQNFASTLVNASGLNASTYKVPGAILNWNTQYYWRANAVDGSWVSSKWSSVYPFKTSTGPPPDAPYNLTATAVSDKQINLSWTDNSTGEEGFVIERKLGTVKQGVRVGPGVTTYNDTRGLKASTGYTYRVKAYRGKLESAWSNEVIVTTLPLPPVAPKGISPKPGSTVATLTPTLDWDEPAGAVTYGLQLSTDSKFTTTLLDLTGLTASTYNITTGLAWNTKYYWRANAVNSSHSTSKWSSVCNFKTEIGEPPAAPSNLTATARSDKIIDLAWTDESTNETAFAIEKKSGAGKFAQIAIVPANSTSFSHTSGLTANTSYTYRVRALLGKLYSAYSNEISVTTLPVAPAAPTLRSPASNATNQIQPVTLDWNDPPGAATYGVQVSTDSNFTALIVNQTGLTTSTYTIPDGIPWNTTYYWRANAANSSHSTSRWSATRNFKTAAGPPPAAPSNLAATAVSATQVNLTWDDNSSNETGFRIERKTGTGNFAQIASMGVNQTSFHDTTSGLKGKTSYTYRIRSYLSTINSAYSNEASATTLSPLTAPALVSPANGATGESLTPTLDWNEAAGANTYSVQVSTVSNFASTVVNYGALSDSFYTIPAGKLNPNTRYYWRVWANDLAASKSVCSVVRYFTTAP